MPTLKCIGGPLDGKEYQFSEREISHWRSGDSVRLPEKMTFKADFTQDIDIEKELTKATIKYHLYVICKLHFHGSEAITFLRSSDLSDYGAILHQMSK